jgi:hypothetical protein
MGGRSQDSGTMRVPGAKNVSQKQILESIMKQKFGPQIAANKAAADKAAADKAAAEKVAADKVIADKITADKTIADTAVEKATADALVPAQTMQNATPLQAGAYAPVSAAKTPNLMATKASTTSIPQPAATMNQSAAAAAAAATQANKTSTGVNQFSVPSLNGVTFGGS